MSRLGKESVQQSDRLEITLELYLLLLRSTEGGA